VRAWVCAAMIFASGAEASEHRFAFTYESSVLNPGAVEIEPWTTVELGRDAFYDRVEERLEIELGLGAGVQTSVYLNFSGVTEDIGTKRFSSSGFDGVSWETKWKLLDPVADAVGLALYVEPSFGPAGAELEGKVILDKRFGDFLVAGNVVLEHEIGFDEADVHHETELVLTSGFAYFVQPTLSVGLEVTDTNVIAYDAPGLAYESSVLFAGPAVSWSTQRFWVVAAVMPQIGAPLGPTSGQQNYEDFARLQARVALGVSL
jgi:hypothetical protein